MKFAIEIIDCENGYIILDGNSYAHNQPLYKERKVWIAEDATKLAAAVFDLATEALASDEKEG